MAEPKAAKPMRYRPWLGLTLISVAVVADILLTPAHSQERGLITAGTMFGVWLWADRC